MSVLILIYRLPVLKVPPVFAFRLYGFPFLFSGDAVCASWFRLLAGYSHPGPREGQHRTRIVEIDSDPLQGCYRALWVQRFAGADRGRHEANSDK